MALVVCALAWHAPFGYKAMTGSFRLGKLAFDLPHDPALETVPVQIPCGTFTYLARGAQSFVFASDDGRCILKLFRREQWVHPWRKKFRKNNRQKPALQDVLRAAKLAFDKAQDLTGLVAVHLNSAVDQMPVVLRDKTGRKHTLDLNRYHFAVQHRGKSFREELFRAMQEHNLPKTEQLLASLVQLLEARARRGIRNTDAKVSSNFGLLGDQAIEWDFGCYTAAEVDVAQEIERFAPALRRLLKKRSPEAVAALERILEAP